MPKQALNRRDFLKLSSIATLGGALYLNQNRVLPATFSPRNADLGTQAEAARFLTQATLGANLDLIEEVAAIGPEEWLERQFTLRPHSTEKLVWGYDPELKENLGFGEPQYFRWAWWQQVMTEPDILRHRIALALSEIFVISTRPDLLEDSVAGIASYYDMLGKHAFGNFRDLLLDVTLHPTMGFYLSHLKNRKSDPALNRFPDENYAREVMQLFSIGLWELNPDGSRKLDRNGEPIPTYSNKEITEFAKVFTGLAYYDAKYEEDFLTEDGPMYLPMSMYEPEHEPGQKRLLNGFVVPAGQSGMQDIEDAIDNLFNHPNVGPFIGRLLIQRLVTSNPSPEYISRVSAAFDDNGRGVRGDMQALIRAILLDPEARDLEKIKDPAHGMLREPFVRYTHIMRAMNAHSRDNTFRNEGEMAEALLQQYPFFSPSVFNFFLPDYRPLGVLSEASLVAPEFQITTSFTALTAINMMDNVIVEGEVIDQGFELFPTDEEELEEEEEPEQDEDLEADEEEEDPEDEEELDEEDPDEEEEDGFSDFFDSQEASPVELDFSQAKHLADDPASLVNYFDLLLTYGSLSSQMSAIIQQAVSQLPNTEQRVKMALYLISISPDFAVLK